MNRLIVPLCALGGLCWLAAFTPAWAQERPGSAGLSAQMALSQLTPGDGSAAPTRFYEMVATGGDPQPIEWLIVAAHPDRGNTLHEWRTDGQDVAEPQLRDDFYPDKLPSAFFSKARLKLDSTQAFAQTEQIAREAKVGFNSVDYRLHGRPYMDEPVWTLTLLNEEEAPVGHVHLSASTGELLRTVWYGRNSRGGLTVRDSALEKLRRADDEPQSSKKTLREPIIRSALDADFGSATVEAADEVPEKPRATVTGPGTTPDPATTPFPPKSVDPIRPMPPPPAQPPAVAAAPKVIPPPASAPKDPVEQPEIDRLEKAQEKAVKDPKP